MYAMNYEARASDEQWIRMLCRNGAIYLRQVGKDDRRLLRLANALGTVIAPGVAMPSGVHDGRIHTVEVRNGGVGLKDQHENTILSTTNREFTLHTDAYNQRHPPRYVFLLRSDDTQDTTPSYVSDAHRVIAEAAPRVVATLRQAIFPSALGPTAIIGRAADNTPRVRFNQEEITRWGGRGENPLISAEGNEAIAALRAGLIAHQETTMILPGDCLILDNQRVCHGRGEMAPTSKRVLKRVWVA